MNNQLSSRHQRPKGYKVRWALQFGLVLAVCIWILYQITHSNDKNKDYVDTTQRKTIGGENNSAINLGRKGNLGRSSSEGDHLGLEDLDVVRDGQSREDGGAEDDESDRNVEEKAEEEWDHKDNELDSQVGIRAVSLNKDKTGEEENLEERHESFKENVMDGDDQEDTKGPQIQVVSQENADRMNQTSVGQGKDETEDGVHGFHDENGIPQDIIESLQTKSSDSRTNLSSNDRDRSIGRVKARGEKVKEDDEPSNTGDSEIKSRGNLEDINNENGVSKTGED